MWICTFCGIELSWWKKFVGKHRCMLCEAYDLDIHGPKPYEMWSKLGEKEYAPATIVPEEKKYKPGGKI